MFEYLNIFLVNMYRFLFTGFMIANVSSVFYIPKERTPQQNCRNIITQYMESLMMLRQEYPSSVLHHAWKKVYSCLYISPVPQQTAGAVLHRSASHSHPSSRARQHLLLYDSNDKEYENIHTCPFENCIWLPNYIQNQ